MTQHQDQPDSREGRIGTHSTHCWSWGPRHYGCAEALIADLLEAAQEALAAYGPWRGKTVKQEEADDILRAVIAKATTPTDLGSVNSGGEQ